MDLVPIKRVTRRLLDGTASGSRWLWKRAHAVDSPKGRPDAPWWNAVLLSREQVDAAVEQVKRLGLPAMSDRPKNWDSLAALDVVLERTSRRARVLDAGSEKYSMILPWLSMYGYRHLVGCNLVFQRPARMGAIRYEYGDVTATRYADASFDAVTCLSVVEHGVDLGAYFAEMARILKPGGVLVTSTDYWETPLDTGGRTAYGVPIHVFDAAEIRQAFELARGFGFEPLSPIDLAAREKVVEWKPHGLAYTFLVFSMVRAGDPRG
jgi:SAM-dependent methyltransferase